ncbi:hypothetical protein N7452_007533 [Penicillium brevicompactum]|uniref:Uncharacterized protein n=1 Tax=Penicillium brevicompactum TaxID=5074 RepID=A0A9W9QL15_PENBR|nr:hypothetical protein N7452_007533 [Penicillium brevicompactum]
MESDATVDPVVMAAMISRARLDAFVSLSEGNCEKFIEYGKHCIDAHAQATKAMMDDIAERVGDGEVFDWEHAIEELKVGLFNYCQAIVEEAELLMPEALDRPPRKSSLDWARNLSSGKTSSNSLRTSPILVKDPTRTSESSTEPMTPTSLNMSDASGESHLIASSRRRLRLFSVSSDDWIKSSTDSTSADEFEVVLPDGMTRVDESIHLGVVMGVLSKLYTMAKLMQSILLSYGVESDTSESGLLYWTISFEENITSNDLKTLISIAENLFYSLYARVVIELANIELCGTFKTSIIYKRNSGSFLLPEPDHLYRIVLSFKDALDAPGICSLLRKDAAIHFQQSYISQIVDKTKNADFPLHDKLGYRSHAANIVQDRSGPYCTKWKALIPFFNVIPCRNMAMMSECYLALAPRNATPDDVPFGQLPFIDTSKIAADIRDAENIKDNRIATLAKLEGTSVGEERQKDPKCRTYYLAKQRKCVCFAICVCAKECTKDVLRSCPCAERHVRIMTVRRGLHYRWPGLAFSTTAGTLARMFFHGFASLRRGVTDRQIAGELERAFDSIEALITSEREKDKSMKLEREKAKRDS